jgi:hypothetical protein
MPVGSDGSYTMSLSAKSEKADFTYDIKGTVVA